MDKFELMVKVGKIIMQRSAGLGCECHCDWDFPLCENCAWTAETIVDSLFNDDLTLKDS